LTATSDIPVSEFHRRVLIVLVVTYSIVFSTLSILKYLDYSTYAFANPQAYTDSKVGRLTARMVSSLRECSDQTARKGVDRYYLEKATA
jgi:hypothetical protein